MVKHKNKLILLFNKIQDFYKEGPTKRIVDNYEFLVNNELLIDEAVKLYEQKRMDEFYTEYKKVSELIPAFSMTLKDTENKIKLIKSNKLKVDESELAMFNQYITEISKNKIKKYMKIKKVGDDLLKKKATTNFSDNRYSLPDEMPNNQFHARNYSHDILQPFNEMKLELNERQDKINQIQDKSDSLRNTAERYKKAAAKVAKKSNKDCTIFQILFIYYQLK